MNGGLGKREGARPASGAGANAFVCTVAVPSVDETIGAIEKLGGKITHPKHVIPSVGWLVDFEDSEGNALGAIQEDPKAA